MMRNVMVILCDQLRRDFISCYGADFMETPNLNALAENGVRFGNAQRGKEGEGRER